MAASSSSTRVVTGRWLSSHGQAGAVAPCALDTPVNVRECGCWALASRWTSRRAPRVASPPPTDNDNATDPAAAMMATAPTTDRRLRATVVAGYRSAASVAGQGCPNIAYMTRRVVVAALAAAVVAGACSSSKPASSKGGSTKPATASGSPTPGGSGGATGPGAPRLQPSTSSTVLVPTAGLPAFYAVPSPLPDAPAGTLLKAETVQLPGLHGAMFRVMYVSTTALGAPVAVTGLVAVPSTPPPPKI